MQYIAIYSYQSFLILSVLYELITIYEQYMPLILIYTTASSLTIHFLKPITRSYTLSLLLLKDKTEKYESHVIHE